MRRIGSALAAGVLMLSGCFAATAEVAAPSSQVAALTAAATATAAAPTGTPIVLPTATPGSTPTTTPAQSASAAGSPRLAPPPSSRPNVGPASRATAVPAPDPSPSTAAALTPTPQPFPTLPPNAPVLIPTPLPSAGEAVAVDERSRPLVERASRMLADELGIAVADVTLVLLEAVVWPDGGLGCARPGQIVQPIETPGYRIVLAAAGGQYEYHTDLDQEVVRCAGGPPAGG